MGLKTSPVIPTCNQGREPLVQGCSGQNGKRGMNERQKLLHEAKSQDFSGERFLGPSSKMCLDKVGESHLELAGHRNAI